MTQFLRPDSDIETGAWEGSDGSSPPILWPLLDETSPEDADFAFTEEASSFTVGLSDATDPASSDDHIVRYRAQGNGVLDLRVTLIDTSTSPDTEVASWVESAAVDEFTTYSHELTGGEADSITDYTALRLAFDVGDFTAPTLSNASDGTPTSDGADDPSVDTDEGNGTLYWAVLTDGGSATDAQIKAGSGGDIVDAGNQAVSGTGTQTLPDITGLDDETNYEIVYLHSDAAGNDSAQAEVGLTTEAAGGGVTPSRTGTPAQLNASGGDGSTSVTVPDDCNGIVAFWDHWDGNAGSTLATLTLNSVGFTTRSELAEGAATDESGVGVATLMSPATGSQTVAWTWSAGGARSEGGAIVLVFYKDCNTSDPVRAAGTNAATSSTEPTVSLASTDATDRVVGFTQSFSTGTPNLTGVTVFIDEASLNNHEYDVGDDTGLSGTVIIGNSGPNYSATAAISLKAS